MTDIKKHLMLICALFFSGTNFILNHNNPVFMTISPLLGASTGLTIGKIMERKLKTKHHHFC